MNAGLFERKQENLTVTAEGAPSESALKELLKSIKELLFHHRTHKQWGEALATRRHPSDRGPDPDYERILREREGSDYEPRIRIDRYDEGGGKHSWKDWILTIVGVLIVAWLARLDSKLDTIADLRAQQTILEKRQDQTDKHLESTDGRVDRVENKVYRGSP